MKYKFLKDLTSDVMFEAYGKTLKNVFENAALALSEVTCHDIKPKESIKIEVRGEDAEELMHNWLQELIARIDIEEMFFSRFKILEINEKHLKAKCYGEPMSRGKGETVVKGVTNYKYKLEKTREGYVARVALDI